MGRACSTQIRNAYNILLRKPEGKRPHGGPVCGWEDKIRLGLWEIGWVGVVWMHLAQDAGQLWSLVNIVMNLKVT